ncbi:9215_t:CDS:2 [Entrophospora sp. SA101]|nr:6905_t:CDS:2 [Entrophospora sp. SA101]CAJ0650798.1 4458_t:CDS:2 [Entrophospora sp. SA101]CAJ0746081.1 13461_t:CDS:2 [Entrophospora sp. SA101]CAJ0768100.1 9215_t:CDS:2 [Entrophospora sp. SA101]CAJ0831336.1 757_t:CDS:2 [Entrophospora sp. SA101]
MSYELIPHGIGKEKMIMEYIVMNKKLKDLKNRKINEKECDEVIQKLIYHDNNLMFSNLNLLSDEVNEGNEANEYTELERPLDDKSERRIELIKYMHEKTGNLMLLWKTRYSVEHLTARERRKYNEKKLTELGAKKSKGDKIPISVSLGMKKKQFKRQKKELEEAKNIGLYHHTIKHNWLISSSSTSSNTAATHNKRKNYKRDKELSNLHTDCPQDIWTF